ncbi:MAG: glycosyltransferase WbuB [Acidobacteriota bacterium]|nr:glycosyltransferase WbuB [Acidobacteriota bacterium]
MRILIYGLNYAPELTGIGKYTGEMADWLAERGHEVRVVTAPPYYPAWRIREDYQGKWYRTERVPGAPLVYRTPLYVPERPTGLKRIAHLASFMLGSFPVMLREMFWQPEVVFTVEPTFFCAPLTLFVGKSAGAACWLHVQDFEVDAAFELGLLPPQGPVHDGALRIEKFFTYAFDRVSGISSRMVDRAISKGIPSDRIVLFPNWVDTNEIYPLDPAARTQNSFRRQLSADVPGIESKVILLYSGNMGAKQGLELLAPLAETFEDDARIHFLFCGDGAFRKRLEELVSHRPNVTLLPLQPMDRLNDLLNVADIHLLPQRASAADLVMPSRLSAMLATGRPVIATAHAGTQVAQMVEGRGLAVPAEDAEALHAAVSQLVEDEPLRLHFGRGAREYAVEHLGKQQVLKQFEIDLQALVSRN